jgi:uncharacterized membrane protein
MLAAVRRLNGAALRANLHLLFWLSLVPFAAAWISENEFPPVPGRGAGGFVSGAGKPALLPRSAGASGRLQA